MSAGAPRPLAVALAIALGGLGIFGLATVSIPPWSAAALHAGAWALAAATALAFLGRPWQPAGARWLIPLAGCVVWGGVQLWERWTVYRFPTEVAVLEWGARLAIAVVSLQALAQRRVRDGFVGALVALGALGSVFAVVQFYTSGGKVLWLVPSPYGDPVLGPFFNPDHYAAWIELVLPIAVWRAWTLRRQAGWYAAAAGVMFASVLAGASRAGTALAAAGIVAVSAVALRRGWARPRSSVLIPVSLLLASAVVGGELLWNRLSDSDPWRVRREFLFSSLEMIAARPLTGAGLGTWPEVYPAYARIDPGVWANHAHNDWAEWTADGGLPFLALLLWLVGESARALRRAPWALGVLCVAAHSLVDYPLAKAPLALLLVMLTAAAVAEAGDEAAG